MIRPILVSVSAVLALSACTNSSGGGTTPDPTAAELIRAADSIDEARAIQLTLDRTEVGAMPTGTASYSGPAFVSYIAGTSAIEEDGTAQFDVDFVSGDATGSIETATVAQDWQITDAMVENNNLVMDITGTVDGAAIDEDIVGRFYGEDGSVLTGRGDYVVPSLCNFDCPGGTIIFYTGAD